MRSLRVRRSSAEAKDRMGAPLTSKLAFGMNALTLAGFVLTGFGLIGFGAAINRMSRADLPLCIGVLGVGMALMLVGLCTGGWPR